MTATLAERVEQVAGSHASERQWPAIRGILSMFVEINRLSHIATRNPADD